MTTFTNTSILSGAHASMDFNCSESELAEGFSRYAGGDLLQDAFAFLSVDQREFIKTGITPQEWDAEFGEGFSQKSA